MAMETFTSDPKTRAHEGRIADNIVHFARTLRKAGVRVGPASVVDATSATSDVDGESALGSRAAVPLALHPANIANTTTSTSVAFTAPPHQTSEANLARVPRGRAMEIRPT